MLKVFTDARCLGHEAPVGYPECPRRLDDVVAHLGRLGGPLEPSQSHPVRDEAALVEAIARVHDPDYIERFQRAVERRDGLLDSADNPLSVGTWDAALGAVDAALAAADWMIEESQRHAFVAVRPPGHHAERNRAMGFCFFDTVAVAAQYLIDHHGLERVAILDFDVHHGNGTQHLFEDRGDVYFASLHQFPFYPGTGSREETGRGEGKGATLNVPMPVASDDGAYAEVWKGEILPGLRRARPQALLVSAGFDAWLGDPLGGMRVTRQAYRQWGEWLRDLAVEATAGQSLSLLEGGYDLDHLPSLVEAYLRGLGEDDSWPATRG